MIIVHALTHYYPFLGGMERVVQGLAEAQSSLGHDVHVITSRYGAELSPQKECINHVNLHRVNALRLYYPDLTFPKEIPVELIKKADIVHVHGHNSLFNRKVLKKAKQLSVKTACYFMALNTYRKHPNPLVRFFGSYYGPRSTVTALKTSDLVLVRSLRDLDVLSKEYNTEAFFLPDAVQQTVLTFRRCSCGEFRKKFNINQENFFVFIGRMHKLKGPHILIKALKYVNNNVAAVFIGPDGGYLKETKNLAEKLGVKDRVYLLGCVDEVSKVQALDSMIGLVLPSIADFETYPGVISEAWAREKPIVASNVGGIPYMVKQRINGILVEPSNARALANALSELLNNSELSNELGRAGKVEVFSWKAIAEKSIRLYKLLQMSERATQMNSYNLS